MATVGCELEDTPGVTLADTEEPVYGNMDSLGLLRGERAERGPLGLRSCSSGGAEESSEQGGTDKALSVLQTIVETEAVYIKNLELLVKVSGAEQCC